MTYMIDPAKVRVETSWNQPALLGFILEIFAVILGIVDNIAEISIAAAKTAAWNLRHAWDFGNADQPAPNYMSQVIYEPGFLLFAVIIFFVTLGGLIAAHLAFQEKYFGQHGRGLAIAALVIGYLILVLQVFSLLAR